jgi:hypothetical protein
VLGAWAARQEARTGKLTALLSRSIEYPVGAYGRLKQHFTQASPIKYLSTFRHFPKWSFPSGGSFSYSSSVIFPLSSGNGVNMAATIIEIRPHPWIETSKNSRSFFTWLREAVTSLHHANLDT